MKYFEKFPVIDYNNVLVKNLLVRVKLLEQAKNDRTIYHPFTIIDGEKPEKIAYDYYGSVDYTWLIYIVNGMIDPYYDWPLSGVEFDNFIKQKYGSFQAAQANILYYVKTPTSYYVNINDPNDFQSTVGFTGDASKYKLVTQDSLDIRISPDSYAANPSGSYSAMDAYTFEVLKNEEKRNIKLLDRAYAREMDDELKSLLEA